MRLIGILAVTVLGLHAGGCNDGGARAGGGGVSCDIDALTLQNLGVDFGTWNGVDGAIAGDFRFTGPDPMMNAYGTVDGVHDPATPSLDFWLDVNADIVAPVAGTISRFAFQEADSDYEIEILANGCQVYFDHILDPQVALGDEVSVGQVIGKPGPWNEAIGIGMTELTVQSGDVTYCPVEFLDPAVAPGIEAALTQLMSDGEDLISDTGFFDEASMVAPGCYSSSLVFN